MVRITFKNGNVIDHEECDRFCWQNEGWIELEKDGATVVIVAKSEVMSVEMVELAFAKVESTTVITDVTGRKTVITSTENG